MKYCHVGFAIAVLTMPSAAAAETLALADKTVMSNQVEPDLTGNWQQDGGPVFRFSQAGSSLTSRYSEPTDSDLENPIDFTATIYGNLVYGAYRAPFSRAQLANCSHQIWVGMGLTLNAERTQLTGFRGARILDPTSCSVKDSAPVELAYTRIGGAKPAE